jgi:FkbM family methyltransferase
MMIPQRFKPLARSARLLLRGLLGREILFQREVTAPTEFHGNDYGGWAILRDSLTQNAQVISAGVGEDASFDLSIIQKYGCTVHALDPTPKAVGWVREHIQDPRFVLHEWALSAGEDSLRLYLPVRDEFVSASCRPGQHTSKRYVDVPAVSLPVLFERLDARTVDLLKMDIEGAEYGVIAHALQSGVLGRVRQLLVEFHHYHPAFGLPATRKAVRDLRDAGWRIAWVSPSHHELLFLPARFA